VVEPAVDAPLSPELVLVSPDLKARALVEERIARPRPYLVLPLDEIVPLQPDVATPQIPAPPLAPVQASPPPPEWHLTVGAATLIVLAAVAVFGAGLAIGRFAIVSPPSESATPSAVPPTAAPAPTATQNAEPATPSVSATPSVAATPVPARPKPSSPPTPAEGSAARPVYPVPNGGYILPKQRGRFRLSSDGRTIVDFTLATSCAGALTLPPIEVGTTGRFAFAGHPAASPSGATVRVEGRFVSSAEARGTAQVFGAGCRVPAAPFVARLS
jgi:hypothetical protein